MRFFKRNLGFLYDTAVTYPAPTNLNYNITMAFMLSYLSFQIISGIFLVCLIVLMLVSFPQCRTYYERCPYGWFVRYLMLMVPHSFLS